MCYLRTEGELHHIVQDADKLDALGAVGLKRAYASYAHLPAYNDGDIVPAVRAWQSDNSRSRSQRTAIHEQVAFQMEFANMLYTDAGRAIARKREAIMRDFLQKFEDEVTGKDF